MDVGVGGAGGGAYRNSLFALAYPNAAFSPAYASRSIALPLVRPAGLLHCRADVSLSALPPCPSREAVSLPRSMLPARGRARDDAPDPHYAQHTFASLIHLLSE